MCAFSYLQCVNSQGHFDNTHNRRDAVHPRILIVSLVYGSLKLLLLRMRNAKNRHNEKLKIIYNNYYYYQGTHSFKNIFYSLVASVCCLLLSCSNSLKFSEAAASDVASFVVLLDFFLFLRRYVTCNSIIIITMSGRNKV